MTAARQPPPAPPRAGHGQYDGPRRAGHARRSSPATSAPPQGVRIDVNELSRLVRVRNRGELTLLDAVSFTLSAGELVAIVGPSGAGKTTLLEAIAGIAPATSGSVRFDGIDLHANLGTFRSVLGYVPQDDIIHADLPLQRMLRYAARLRLPSSTTAAEVDDAVRDAIDAVGLTGQADVRVGSLSGGQRKRASIAVELLTDPHVFFLDEPTSGLDPVTSAELIARLRQLADRSATVVFTTHSVEDLARVRSHRVHDPRWASGLRRHRRRGARAVRRSARSPSSTVAWPTWTAPPTQPARPLPQRRPTPVPET